MLPSLTSAPAGASAGMGHEAVARRTAAVLADWWFTVDRVLLADHPGHRRRGAAAVAGGQPGRSPSSAGCRPSISSSATSSLPLAAWLSCWPCRCFRRRSVRRLALAVLLASLRADGRSCSSTGAEINGARRWLHIGGYSLQPSEFAKPAFVVLSAWLFAESERRPDMPAMPLAVRALPACSPALLVLQPDVGQTLLVSLVWCALFLLAGRPLALALGAGGGAGAARSSPPTMTFGYVRLRIDRFLHPAARRQLPDRSGAAVLHRGRLLRQGPRRGHRSRRCCPTRTPTSSSRSIAEEYGVLACLVILGLFALVAIRVFCAPCRREPDAFRAAGGRGLALLLFALQAHHQHGRQCRARCRPKASRCPSFPAAARPCLRSV